MKKKEIHLFLYDILSSFISAAIVAFAFHYFVNYNNFAPGGVSGLAAISAHLAGINMGYFLVLYNLPIFITVFILIDKRTAVILTVYTFFQAMLLFLLEELRMPYYEAKNNLIFAAIGVGVVSGFGYSMTLKRFGSAGGTYAISSIIRHFKPEKNLAWVAFAMDCSVVFLAFFAYGFNVDSLICTLVNLFIANLVADYALQGLKTGYKFEIVTIQPDALAREIMEKFDHGVTRLNAVGMYTNQEKAMLVCIVRKREVGEFMKLLKSYPHTFSTITKINEVIGKFRK
jgi:uncharacterized membrane-anchored protein YitT (DUF2179 family)